MFVCFYVLCSMPVLYVFTRFDMAIKFVKVRSSQFICSHLLLSSRPQRADLNGESISNFQCNNGKHRHTSHAARKHTSHARDPTWRHRKIWFTRLLGYRILEAGVVLSYYDVVLRKSRASRHRATGAFFTSSLTWLA